MKNVLIALCFLIFSTVQAQDYKTHKVQEGETLEQIAKQYFVTPFDILALNPDAKSGLNTDLVLIIPKSKVSDEDIRSERQVERYITHKVKRKETLYSIAQEYDITVDDIKKYNSYLYSQNLRKGDRLEIPRFSNAVATLPIENTISKYAVRPQEGKWRIAYKYGITVEELEMLNPNMSEVLQVGEVINVPNIADNEMREVDDDFGYYTVLPKEGFYRLKLKLGLEQAELESLNPELIDSGLKAGMVLKVPKDIDNAEALANVEKTSLANNIVNYDEKRLAIMLPFRLHRIDLDSIQETKDIIREDRFVSLALDFHSGALMALDSAKRLGISTRLDVFDTRARISEVSKILSDNDFSQYDAVLGPITAASFDRTASQLRSQNIPVVSTLTKPKELYTNVYQTLPSEDYMRKQMINYIKNDTVSKNMIIIADNQNRGVSDQIRNGVGYAKQVYSRLDEDGNDAFYVLKDDIEMHLKEGRNLVFLETANEGFVSNVTSILSALNGITIIKEKDKEDEELEREIILITTNKNRAFDGANISNIDMSNLQFHYPSVNRSYDPDEDNTFVEAYKRRYGAVPNRYAVRGFDITLDILLRLASTDEGLFEASNIDLETQYVENKFRYNKKMFGGYYNEAAYIVRYDNLKLIEIQQ